MMNEKKNKLAYSLILDDESQTNACAGQLGKIINAFLSQENLGSKAPILLYFSGDIGAAKSCFIRAFLRTLGVTSKIKSPTFSIIETYQVHQHTFSHMDLYRIEDEDELHYLGFEELYEESTIMLIEWPEKVTSLPKPDLHINLKSIEFGEKRKIDIQSISKLGDSALEKLISTNKE